MSRTLAVLAIFLVGGGLAACGEEHPGVDLDGDGAAPEGPVLTLGKRSAPWPDEVARSTDDGLVEVLETEEVVAEAWAALAPEELPAGGDAATSLEEGAHLAPDEVEDAGDRVVMRVRHVESGTCPVRVADVVEEGHGLAFVLDDGDPRECTADANPFTALVAVDADRLPPLDELPGEVSVGEHWTLELRRVSAVEELAGTTDPGDDHAPRLGGFEVEPTRAATGEELTVTFPAEDPRHEPDDDLPGAPAPHERGVAFTLERRVGDTWMLEAYLISDRDPDGPRASDPAEVDPPAELLIDDPHPDGLVLPDDVPNGLYRLCEVRGQDRCAHIDIHS